MSEYSLRVKVNQIVTKEVQFLIGAGSEEEAMDKAREALAKYPEPIEVKGIRKAVTNKAHYWIPRDIEFMEVKEEKSVA